MSHNKRVVITGIGPLASSGIGKDDFWKGILKKRVGLKLEEIRIDEDLWDKFYLHKIDGFDIQDFNIDEAVLKDIKAWKNGEEDRDLFYLLAAVKMALEDSQFTYDKEINNIGLFLTVEHPGFEPFCEEIVRETIEFLEKNPSSNTVSKSRIYRHVFEQFSRKGYDLQSFMYLFFVAKAFGLHGYSLFNNNACASGLYALESAARQIKLGDSKAVIVASGDVPSTMFKHLWFKEQNLYAEDGKMKPFSVKADGIVLGDGASALVLEDMEHALNRKAHIYAEYLGGGFSLEGWKVTLPQIGSPFYQGTIREALKKTGLEPEDIDLINPHGVALKATDGYEAKAITDIFGKGNNMPFVSAFKPYVGHNLGGCGILECIVLLLSMEYSVALPILNYAEQDAKYEINMVRELTNDTINTAMKLSCGFAGYNGAVVFRRFH
jgi:3-oxoacyl-[acyl-carrier-protein] synthase II